MPELQADVMREYEQVAMLAAILWAVSATGITLVLLRSLGSLRFERREYRVRVPLLFKMVLPIVPTVRPLIRGPAFKHAIEQTEVKLVQAGLDQVFEGEEFVGMRLVYAVVMCAVGLVFILTGVQILAIFGMLVLVVGLVYPSMWLNGVIRKRHRSIQKALPNVLDLLTLSVEAGRDFLTALREILVHRPRDPLGEELETVFREVQLGKQRRQALSAMADRVGMVDLSSVVETLVQADELGVSIGHILRILGEQMRAKRFATAEKLANESPVKLLFPLFIFIFPAVVIVMLGPILLRSLDGF